MPVVDLSHQVMLDDSLGALTRSVYDASALSQQTFVKLLPKLTELQSKATLFTSHVNQYKTEFFSALRSSSFSLKRALMESTKLTNGISDGAAASVIHSMLKSLEKSNAALIRAIEKKNLLQMSLDSEGKVVASAVRNIQGKTQKSFAVLSVADKIGESAKTVHGMSKNVVERSERAHLAKASPALHEGTLAIKKMLDIERKLLPIKPIIAKEIVTPDVDKELEDAFAQTSRAIDHAQRSLSLSGPARAREIVDVRDQIRNSLDYEQEAMSAKTTVMDPAIETTVLPYSAGIPKVVLDELVPALKAFKVVNAKIVTDVDPSRAYDITERLGRQVLKQSSLGAVLSGWIPSRRDLGNFL